MKLSRRCLLLTLILTIACAMVFTVSAASSSKLPRVELNWYLPATPQKDTALVEEALNKYLIPRINATIKVNFVDWGSWFTKFPVLLASGDNVDIIFTAGWSQFAQSEAKGYFADITDLLPKYCPKTVKNLPKLLFEGARISGRIWAIPTSKELAHTNGLLYPVELAKKYGVYDQLQKFKTSIPRIEDLEPILKTIKEKDPSIYPMIGVGSQGDTARSWCDFDPIGDENVPGKLIKNKDTKVINEYETPEALNIYRVMHKYYKAGYINKDAATLQDATPYIKGMKVFLSGGTTKPLANEEVGMAYGIKMDQFSYTTPFITSNDTQGSMNAVYSGSKNKERALMFLELVNSDPYVNNTLNYGVKGKHWVMKRTNVIDYGPGLDAKTTGYAPNAFWEFGNQFLNYFMVGQNTNKWKLFKQYNDSGVPSKILGFNFDAEPVKNEIAAVMNVKAEFLPQISNGVVDPDVYLPQMVQKMKEAGLAKIIAEKQRQIDAWLAGKK